LAFSNSDLTDVDLLLELGLVQGRRIALLFLLPCTHSLFFFSALILGGSWILQHIESSQVGV
jgi:hypothetical protein